MLETGTGQQVAQLRDRYIMMIMIKLCVGGVIPEHDELSLWICISVFANQIYIFGIYMFFILWGVYNTFQDLILSSIFFIVALVFGHTVCVHNHPQISHILWCVENFLGVTGDGGVLYVLKVEPLSLAYSGGAGPVQSSFVFMAEYCYAGQPFPLIANRFSRCWQRYSNIWQWLVSLDSIWQYDLGSVIISC